MAIAPNDRPDLPVPNPTPDPGRPRTRRTAPGGPGQGRGARGERLVRHFKVDHRLTPEDRVQYEALLLDPRSTIDSLLKWLHARGYTDMTRGGVSRHRRHFELDVKGIRRDARVAGQFAALARAQGGPTALADAGQFRFEQMFLERLFDMKKTDQRGGKEWLELARTMSSLLDNRQQIETQRAEWDRRAKQAAEAVEQAAGGATGIKNGVEIANTVRRILGVPLPGERAPGAAPDNTARSIAMANDVRRRLGAPDWNDPDDAREVADPSNN